MGIFATPTVALPPLIFPGMLSNLEYLFVNAINDAGAIVFRAKEFESLERTYIRLPNGELKELKFPGSVATVARDIDREGQVVGYYDALDGGRYGFIATPLTGEIVEDFSNVLCSFSPQRFEHTLSSPEASDTDDRSFFSGDDWCDNGDCS